MAATATQDDDLIIFNDEETDTTVEETSGGTQQWDDTTTDDEKVEISNDDDIITFDGDDDNKEANEVKDAPKDEEVSTDLWEIEDIAEEEVTELNLESLSTPEDVKEELIDIQDKWDVTSFEDLGIDLGKLGDKEWENLDGINLEESAVPVIEETAITEETQEQKDENLDNEIGSIEDFAAGFADSDIDESTLVGILDATILKINKREEMIGEQIDAKEAETAEIRGEIEHLKIKKNEKEEEIASLQTERKKIVETRDGIEKMKQAS